MGDLLDWVTARVDSGSMVLDVVGLEVRSAEVVGPIVVDVAVACTDVVDETGGVSTGRALVDVRSVVLASAEVEVLAVISTTASVVASAVDVLLDSVDVDSVDVDSVLLTSTLVDVDSTVRVSVALDSAVVVTTVLVSAALDVTSELGAAAVDSADAVVASVVAIETMTLDEGVSTGRSSLANGEGAPTISADRATLEGVADASTDGAEVLACPPTTVAFPIATPSSMIIRSSPSTTDQLSP